MFTHQSFITESGVVVNAYNPNYSGDGDQENHNSRPALCNAGIYGPDCVSGKAQEIIATESWTHSLT
jgi:hypothetical protein